MHKWRSAIVALSAAMLTLPIIPGTANAAVTGSTAVLGQQNSDFTWSCTINPGGATVDVVGRSWTAPSGNSVDVPSYNGGTLVSDPGPGGVTVQRSRISGTAPVTLKFYRDATPNTAYQGRCAWYSPGTNTQLDKTTNFFDLTTGSDVADPIYGAWTGPNTQPPSETYAQQVTRVTSLYCQTACTTLPGQRYFPGSSLTHYTYEAGNRAVVTSINPDIASLNAGSLDAAILAWLRGFPAAPEKVYVTIWHEPDQARVAEGTPAQFIAASRHFADLVHQVKAEAGHANLDFYQVFMAWTVKTNGPNAWLTYYAGDDKVDTVAWDIYRHNADTGDALFTSVYQQSVEHGKPFIVPETSMFYPDTNGVAMSETTYTGMANSDITFCDLKCGTMLVFEANKTGIDGDWRWAIHAGALAAIRSAVALAA